MSCTECTVMKNDFKTIVLDIKRFAVHDGDGIRTTVFLKGCPLRCLWCHNPEGISYKPQIAFYKVKCIGCGECVAVCPSKAHKINESGHIFNRSLCVSCGKCENVCLGKALTFYGKEMTVEDLLPYLLEDKKFYENSGGGVTISGGECLMHPEFCTELLKKLKENNINTAVDTCGFVPREHIQMVMPYTDVFLYDIKAIDEEVHINCTGQTNALILDNLKYIDNQGKKIEIRYPYVPGYNSNQVLKIAEFVHQLKNVSRIKVLPYHNYAGSKYTALGMDNCLPEVLPTSDEIKKANQIISDILNQSII